jgi:hypothetical protein
MSRLRLGGQLCGSRPAGQELVSVSVGEEVTAARQQRPTCAALAAMTRSGSPSGSNHAS